MRANHLSAIAVATRHTYNRLAQRYALRLAASRICKELPYIEDRMKIREYGPGTARGLVDRFVAADLVYGDSTSYSSLISPTSTILTRCEFDDLAKDLSSMWHFYKELNTLYLASLSGELPPWIAKLTEQGLSHAELAVHRMTANAGLEPRMCRIDYVTLGDDRKVAEVQWKSGGPGLFFGIYDVCQDFLPFDMGETGIANIVTSFGNVICSQNLDGDPVAANGVRSVWRRSEKYLERAFHARGVHYRAVDRACLGRVLNVSSAGVSLAGSEGTRKLQFLSSEDFSRGIPDDLVIELGLASVNERVWIETPLNYIYSQKWGLAFPFMEKYLDRFDGHLRDIIIPTALLTSGTFDLRGLVPYLDHPLREMLLGPIAMEKFVDLPASLRKAIVFKCGAGVGPYYSNSRGVFRVSGSRSSAYKLLTFIVNRMVNLGEPWIAQVYIDRKYPVPMCLPWLTDPVVNVAAHARFMVFGSRVLCGEPAVICGLANYGRNWKVTGRSTTINSSDEFDGSAFTDIRINR
jgi:hypothetical protein